MWRLLLPMLHLLLAQCKSVSSTSSQQQAFACPKQALSVCSGDKRATDALVMSASCTSDQIAVKIERRAATGGYSISPDSIEEYALYYNCSTQFNEVIASNGVGIFFVGGTLDVTDLSIATTTEPYSCVIWGCARPIYPYCWSSLKTTAQCEYKGQMSSSSSIDIQKVSTSSAYHLNTGSPLSSSSTHQTLLLLSSITNTPLSGEILDGPISSSYTAFSDPSPVDHTSSSLSLNHITTTMSSAISSSDGPSSSMASFVQQAVESLTSSRTTTIANSAIISSITTSSAGLITTSNQTPDPGHTQLLPGAAVAENNGPTNILMVILSAVFTVIGSCALILLILLLCLILLIRNIKQRRIASQIGGVDLTENKMETIMDSGDIFAGGDLNVQKLDFQGSMITVYHSLNPHDLAAFESTAGKETFTPNRDVVNNCLQHKSTGTTKTSSITDNSYTCTPADLNHSLPQILVSDNCYETTVIMDSSNNGYLEMKTEDYNRDESRNHCVSSVSSSSLSDGYITTELQYREDSIVSNDTALSIQRETNENLQWQKDQELPTNYNNSDCVKNTTVVCMDCNKRSTDEELSNNLNQDQSLVYRCHGDNEYVIMSKIDDELKFIDTNNRQNSDGYHYIT